MNQFRDIFRGKRVLVTGHTGFKGSWLCLWLHELGAKVIGVALAPESTPNHWDLLGLPIEDHRLDIRNVSETEKIIKLACPDIVFHLAAQPLVRRSYRDPIETWSTNVMGTVSVLEACRKQPSVCAIVVVTTDKCYVNNNWHWGYRETDPLGGHDPYSASKAGAELVAASYRDSFFSTNATPLLATARAGNVIGGGDWSEDRLIPDLIRAVEQHQSLEIRSPNATRPWQHVLESLSGYLALGQKLLMKDQTFAQAWNFGPAPEGNCSVASVLEKLSAQWGSLAWHVTQTKQPHEASLLYLDSAKARKLLNWQPVWDINTTLTKTTNWYRAWLEQKEVISRLQLAEYVDFANEHNLEWTQS